MTDIGALHFLSVESDRLASGPIVNLLNGMGAKHVIAARGASAALEALESAGGGIDVVVADLDAAGMDAIELVHGMARRHSRASLIVATAFPPPLAAGVEVVARDYGVCWLGTLQKPLTPRKMADAIALRSLLEAAAVPAFLRRQ